MKNEHWLWFFIGLLALSIWANPPKITREVVVDIRDRETGICSAMYQEGFEWGLGQDQIDLQMWEQEGKSETLVKELLYDSVRGRVKRLN